MRHVTYTVIILFISKWPLGKKDSREENVLEPPAFPYLASLTRNITSEGQNTDVQSLHLYSIIYTQRKCIPIGVIQMVKINLLTSCDLI